MKKTLKDKIEKTGAVKIGGKFINKGKVIINDSLVDDASLIKIEQEAKEILDEYKKEVKIKAQQKAEIEKKSILNKVKSLKAKLQELLK